LAKRILIAEDNELNMKLMSDVLAHKGYDVLQVFDGEAALEAIERNDLDLVLLDIQMPKKSGYEVLDEITKDIPIIIVSAHAMKDEIEKVRNFKHIDYITKPIQIGSFLAKIEEVLQK